MGRGNQLQAGMRVKLGFLEIDEIAGVVKNQVGSWGQDGTGTDGRGEGNVPFFCRPVAFFFATVVSEVMKRFPF